MSTASSESAWIAAIDHFLVLTGVTTRELTESERQALEGIHDALQNLWEEAPNPAKAAALGVACFFLIPVEEGASVTPANAAVTVAAVATCSAALQSFSDSFSDSGNDEDSDDSPSDDSPDGDSSGDDSGEQDPSDQKNVNNAKDQNDGDSDKFTDAACTEAMEDFNKTGDLDALTDFLNEWVCHHGDGTPTTGTCE
ncbi:hypothetical protein [Candidatus Poriferisodalis sp.]|uniref:hypothetical protein n=1 Tax=Candidatus Poriferisodalis sp. TaxID=3101277 RepID=UPI003B016FB1